ncbi:ANKRD50, partial [Symbiodinium sp. CCMP2456]
MAAPGIDVNAGAYSYGWHGSHVRMTPLGMAIIGEIDTGNCRHSLAADLPLAAPRSEILKLLVKDPRTDLEESYFEMYEGGGKVGCGALMLLDTEVDDVQIDYQAAMILMQAGALMTESWVERLGDIENHIAKVKAAIPAKEAEVKEHLERRAAWEAEEAAEREAEAQEEAEEEAKPADEEDKEETEKEYEKKEDGSIVWQGVTFVNDMKHPGLSNHEEILKMEPKLLQSRLDGLGEVKTWCDTVKSGSNVFKTPAAFPPNFCRTAVTLKKCLGKNCAGKVLDFVSFFEFNRRRPIYPLAFHTNVNMFGRPQLPSLMETDRFMRNLLKRLEEKEEEEGEDPAEKAAKEAEKAK